MRILLMLLLGFPLLGCGNGGAAQLAGDKSAALKAKQVTVSPVVKKDFSRSVNSTGSLIPRETAVIRSLIQGPLVQIPVELGNRVRAGEILFQVRQNDTALALESAKASLKTAEANLADLKAWRRTEEVRLLEAEMKRAEAEGSRLQREKERSATLLEKGAISRSEWDRDRTAAEVAGANLEMARQQLEIARQGPTEEQLEVAQRQVAEGEARVATARQQLEDATVRAPYPGVIIGKFRKMGDYVNRAEEVVEIADLSYLEAEMKIPERYSGLMALGIPVDLSIESVNTKRTGEIIAVNESIDRETRTFLVKVGIPNEEFAIKAGAFCTGRFRLPVLEDIVAVPTEALQSQEGRSYVWVNSDGTARKTYVKTSERGEDFTAVREGLSEDAEVVIEGAGALSDGDALEVTRSKTSTSSQI